LTGAFLMSRALLKVMMKEKWGRIINVSSVVAQSGAPGTAAYAAAKAGLLGLTATLAKEYARFNITVNCLTLGYFSEGLIHTIPDSAKQALLGRIPLRRLGAHADVAGAVRYLMGAAYTTGARLDVTGGFS
jgi:3-oxoacyl-[acyl-carrier protein] reductase